jgi:hypothetical protein
MRLAAAPNETSSVREFDGMAAVYMPLGGLLMVVNLQFASHDPNVGRGLDADADAVADDPIDRDHDPIADDEFFADFSTEH